MADEKIRIEPSNEISVNAKLEYSVAHKRDHTVIKYKSGAKNIAHYILHELMHLEMILSASKSDRNYFCVPNQESYPEFEEIFNGYFDEVNKLKRDTVIRNLFDGLNSQIFNNPIDLFVEDKTVIHQTKCEDTPSIARGFIQQCKNTMPTVAELFFLHRQ